MVKYFSQYIYEAFAPLHPLKRGNRYDEHQKPRRMRREIQTVATSSLLPSYPTKWSNAVLLRSVSLHSKQREKQPFLLTRNSENYLIVATTMLSARAGSPNLTSNASSMRPAIPRTSDHDITISSGLPPSSQQSSDRPVVEPTPLSAGPSTSTNQPRKSRVRTGELLCFISYYGNNRDL